MAGIFYTGMFEYDSKFVYIRLNEAPVASSASKGATGIELKVKDVDDARRIASAVLDKLEGYPYRTKDWGEMNRNLFSALRLEKLVMGIILSHHRDRRRGADRGHGDHAGAREAQGDLRAQGARRSATAGS